MIKNDFLDGIWAEVDNLNSKEIKRSGKISEALRAKHKRQANKTVKSLNESTSLKELFLNKKKALTEAKIENSEDKLTKILFPSGTIDVILPADENSYTHTEVSYSVPISKIGYNSYDFRLETLLGADFSRFNDWLEETKNTNIEDIFKRGSHEEEYEDDDRSVTYFTSTVAAQNEIFADLVEYLSTKNDTELKSALIDSLKDWLNSDKANAIIYNPELKAIADQKEKERADKIKAQTMAAKAKDDLFNKLCDELDDNKLKAAYEAAGLLDLIDEFCEKIPNDYEYEGLDIPVESEWSEMRQGPGDPDTDYEVDGVSHGTIDSWNFDVLDAFLDDGQYILLTAWVKAYNGGLDITKENLEKMMADGDDDDFAQFIIDRYEGDAYSEAEEAADSGDYDEDQVSWDD